MLQDFRAVIKEKGEREFGDLSELKALSPILGYQDSKSDVKITLQDT